MDSVTTGRDHCWSSRAPVLGRSGSAPLTVLLEEAVNVATSSGPARARGRHGLRDRRLRAPRRFALRHELTGSQIRTTLRLASVNHVAVPAERSVLCGRTEHAFASRVRRGRRFDEITHPPPARWKSGSGQHCLNDLEECLDPELHESVPVVRLEGGRIDSMICHGVKRDVLALEERRWGVLAERSVRGARHDDKVDDWICCFATHF